MSVTGAITCTPSSATSGTTLSVSVALTGDAGLTVDEIIESMPASTAGITQGWSNLQGQTGSSTTICPIILNSGNTEDFDVTLSVVLRMSDGSIVVPSTDSVTIEPGPIPAEPG